MILNRLLETDTKLTIKGQRVVGAVEATDERQNGQRVYYVVIERYIPITGTTYRTQRVNWFPNNETENVTNWAINVSEGHGDFIGEEGRKVAFRDMLVRARMLPSKQEEEAEKRTRRMKQGKYVLSDSNSDWKEQAEIDDIGGAEITQSCPAIDEDRRIYLGSSQLDRLLNVLNGDAEPISVEPLADWEKALLEG